MASPRDQRSEQADTYRRLYRTKRWKETRADQLRRHPLCAMCLPRITAATVCDHIDKTSKATEDGFFAAPSSRCARPTTTAASSDKSAEATSSVAMTTASRSTRTTTGTASPAPDHYEKR